MKIKLSLLIVLCFAFASINFAQSKTKVVAPETVVKNLYAAQKNPKTAPFFQNKNRALLDRYFDALFIGDNIWTDAVAVGKGKTSAINFHPLFSSQNPQTAVFTITRDEKPGDDGHALVNVKFKNAGRAEEVNFDLRSDDAENWKIINIYYSDREDLYSLLMYSQDAEFREQQDRNTSYNYKGDFLIGNVKCNFTPTGQLRYRVKCADRADYQVYTIANDGLTNLIEINGKQVELGRFVFFEHESEGEFINASGKKVKVVALQKK